MARMGGIHLFLLLLPVSPLPFDSATTQHTHDPCLPQILATLPSSNPAVNENFRTTTSSLLYCSSFIIYNNYQQYQDPPFARPLAKNQVHSKEGSLPRIRHGARDQSVDLDAWVVIIEPQARFSVPVIARSVRRSISSRIIERSIEGNSGIDNLCNHTGVLGREFSKTRGNGGVILGDGCSLSLRSPFTLSNLGRGTVNCCSFG